MGSYSIGFTPLKAPERQIATELLISKSTLEANLVVDVALKALQTYPAQPADSRYRRSFLLRRGWRKEVSTAGGVYTVRAVNRITPYVRRVQGPLEHDGQAAIHRGRWITVDALRKELRGTFIIRMAKLRRKYGGVVGGGS